MSNRKDSFDEYNSTCDNTIAGDDLNRAILLSFSDTLSATGESLSTTSTGDCSFKLDSTNVEKNIEPADKRSKPIIIGDEIFIEPYDLRKKQTFVSRIPKYACEKSKQQLTRLNDDKESSNVREAKKVFNIESIRQSSLWPALTALEDSLNVSDEQSSKENADILEKLNEEFSYSPRTFTESLMTIIEESLVESDKTKGDVSMFGLLDLLKKTLNAGKLLEDESPPACIVSLPEGSKKVGAEEMGNSSGSGSSGRLKEAENKSPECIISLLSESQIQTDPKKWLKETNESQQNEGNAFADESTQYLNLQGLKLITSSVIIPTPDAKKFVKTPKIIVSPATPINVAIRLAKRTANYRRSRTPTKKTYYGTPRITPKINANVGGCEAIVDHRMGSSNLSRLNSNDDDEYLTAESETEASEVSENAKPEPSSKKKLNMSNITSQHHEWLRTYEQISRYKSGTYDKSLTTTERTRKLSTHKNKLEKRWIERLSEKRQKCFELVDEMLQRSVSETKEPEIKSPYFCPPCKLTKEFCSILSACHEYVQYAMNGGAVCETGAKKSPRFVTSLKMNLGTTKCQSPHSPRNSMSKARKSLSKPSGARSIGTRSKFTSSPSNRGVSIKNIKGTSPVDTSSIRPVSQLRRVFSPTPKTAGCSESNIPRANKIKQKKNLSTIGSERKGSVRFIATHNPCIFKRTIVSPVREYIRGKKAA